MATQLKRVTATGYAAQRGGYLKSVSLTAGSDAATCTVRDGDGGTVLVTIKAAAGTTAQWRSGDPDGALVATGVHITLAGTGPEATAEVE